MESYSPSTLETKWNDKLNPITTTTNSKTFSMIVPPPNITGSLHIGHALTLTIEDVIVRHKKACGYNTVWVPGTDSASLATEVVVAKKLEREQGLRKQDIGRDAFIKMLFEWKEKYDTNICDQMKMMGSALNWDRKYFTMDSHLNEAVTEAFVRLHEKGLIYRAKKMINWCSAYSRLSLMQK